MRLDLRLLEVFCCVYKLKSFSKAGEELLLSQPTVSGHIRNLEELLGVRLFERLSRRIIPTKAASILYSHGLTILNERAVAVQKLKGFLDRVEGPLSVSASSIPGEYLLPQILVSLQAQSPGIRVNLKISDSQKVSQEVAEGAADLGFVGAKIDNISLDFRHFASDELVLVAPNNKQWEGIKTLSMEELLRRPFLARERGSGTRLAFEKRMGRSLDEFNVVVTLGSTNAVKQGLKAGLGVSVLSLLSVREDLDNDLKLIKISGIGPIQRHFFAVVNRRLTLSPVAECLLDFIQSGPEPARRLDAHS
ncbi:MAG: selenium metabolism-associated LysR family transcriptional regulator [Acidobacteriota bacterium]